VDCFESCYFADAAQVPGGLAVLGRKKSLDKIPRDRRADGPAAHTKDIHVIIFHTLLCRKVVMNQRGAGAWNFIGANSRADAAATNGDAAFHLTTDYGLGQRNDEVGVVVVGTQLVSAEIHDFVACSTELSDYFLF
jgi:hypothetical protein